jgi:hypothetical protein
MGDFDYEGSFGSQTEGDACYPTIAAGIAGSFTYASHQNAIPVIRSIKIENTGGDDHDDCRLDLTSSPAFLRPKTWTIDRLVVMRLSVSLRLSP